MTRDALFNFAIWLAVFGLLVWGLGLIFMPEMVHPMGSADPMNPATTGTLGAVLVAFAVVLLFIAINPGTVLIAVALGLAIIAVMRLFLMFVTGAVLVNPVMLVVPIVGILAAVIILMKTMGQ